VAISAVVAGCLGGSTSGEGSGEPPPPPPAVNEPPSISGTPPTALQVNEDYDFRPRASDPDGDALTFSIQNRPDWATFDSATGRLHGRPGEADVGQFTDIAISVSDGNASDSLAAFAISVNQVGLGSITLSWSPPTTDADGTAITGLAGYRIYYGQTPDSLDEIVVINNPGTIRYVIENLSPATWFFCMTSFNDSGLESVRTAIGSKSVT